MRMLSGNVSVNVFKSDAVFWWAAIFRKGGWREGKGEGRCREKGWGGGRRRVRWYGYFKSRRSSVSSFTYDMVKYKISRSQ